MEPPTTRFLPGPLKRLRGLLLDTRGIAAETHDALSAARAESAAQLEGLRSRVEALATQQRAEHQQMIEILRFVHDRAQWRRRQLRELRTDSEYERAFQDPEPLISVVIATYDQHA
jgi:hypothetical protein